MYAAVGLSSFLLMLGLGGLLARQRDQFGRTGLIGFWVTLLGLGVLFFGLGTAFLTGNQELLRHSFRFDR